MGKLPSFWAWEGCVQLCMYKNTEATFDLKRMGRRRRNRKGKRGKKKWNEKRNKILRFSLLFGSKRNWKNK